MHKSIISASVILGLSAYGGPNLNRDKLLNLPINCSGLTRIAVKNTRINDVVVFPEHYASRVTLHKSGQVFINAKNLPQQFQLSLLLQGGITQDLKLQCAPVDQGPIILENNPEPFSPEEADFIEKTIKSVLKGEFKDGTSISTEDVSIRKTSSLEWKPMEQWQKGSYYIQLFKTKNESPDSVALRTFDVREAQDLAIAFDQETIGTKQKAQMVIIRKPKPSEGDNHEKSKPSTNFEEI
jgi:hypothetical protein